MGCNFQVSNLGKENTEELGWEVNLLRDAVIVWDELALM